MTATVDQTDTGNLDDDNIARKWSYRYPELGIGAVTTDRFISQEQFDRERRDVFAKSWVNIGSVHDLDGNSSFFTRDIKVLGASLLVVQDKKGDIRAFHNVCSHRQNKLVWEDKGPCSQFISCRFHGWAFSQQGNLASVPDDGEFHFDAGGDAPAQSELGLVAVHTEVWNGFIFVNLGENPESLEEYLGPLGTSLKDFPSRTSSCGTSTRFRTTPTGRSSSTRRTRSTTFRCSPRSTGSSVAAPSPPMKTATPVWRISS